MRIFIKRILPLMLAAVMAGTLAACAAKLETPGGNASPTNSPRPSASPAPSAAASAEPSASPEASADPSGSPETSGDPSGSPDASDGPMDSPGNTGDVTGMIEGFMEGVVVDPKDVPELIAMLAAKEDYKDMSVQSITYKTFEGRQAYYVILQGEGEASHPVYVFADDTVTPER